MKQSYEKSFDSSGFNYSQFVECYIYVICLRKYIYMVFVFQN